MKKRLLPAVAGTILFLFVLPARGAMLLDRIVAIVNKEVITWGELYRAMEFKITEEYRNMSDAEKRKVFKESEAAFLEGMIDTRLQLQAARKLEIDASKEEVAEAIGSIRAKYSMGEKEFLETLRKEGFTIDEYRKLLGEQIIISKIVSQQVRSKVVVTGDEIDAYLAKKKDDGYRIHQIFLKRPEKEADRAAVEARSQELHKRILAGEDFTMLARQHSEDPSGRTGGDLGLIRREHLSREFLDVIAGLKEGEVSAPFWTGRGIHIIRLDEKEEGKTPEQRREDAQRRLQDKKFSEEYRNWIKGLRERSFVEVKL